ncbi:MAPK-interacting and spindle-stabilizing protein-like [Vombatus ursinus]|uniref:MAPK-interacting and spindle-stabilizing protein-like n=1 Tax=Vombatus ursinus TaxID=29139 RepID=UPI000FFD7435|nr:MAPK-interacting and spindle-stabilizing protein-like [Vombatus ursinus]
MILPPPSSPQPAPTLLLFSALSSQLWEFKAAPLSPLPLAWFLQFPPPSPPPFPYRMWLPLSQAPFPPPSPTPALGEWLGRQTRAANTEYTLFHSELGRHARALDPVEATAAQLGPGGGRVYAAPPPHRSGPHLTRPCRQPARSLLRYTASGPPPPWAERGRLLPSGPGGVGEWGPPPLPGHFLSPEREGQQTGGRAGVRSLTLEMGRGLPRERSKAE